MRLSLIGPSPFAPHLHLHPLPSAHSLPTRNYTRRAPPRAFTWAFPTMNAPTHTCTHTISLTSLLSVTSLGSLMRAAPCSHSGSWDLPFPSSPQHPLGYMCSHTDLSPSWSSHQNSTWRGAQQPLHTLATYTVTALWRTKVHTPNPQRKQEGRPALPWHSGQALPSQQPHLAFSHVQDGNLVRVI